MFLDRPMIHLSNGISLGSNGCTVEAFGMLKDGGFITAVQVSG